MKIHIYIKKSRTFSSILNNWKIQTLHNPNRCSEKYANGQYSVDVDRFTIAAIAWYGYRCPVICVQGFMNY